MGFGGNWHLIVTWWVG